VVVVGATGTIRSKVADAPATTTFPRAQRNQIGFRCTS
jgi:hypothetical protein